MSFSGVLGQETALKTLDDMLRQQRVPPALLFFGPSGVGKKAAAIQFAKTLNAEGRALEVDPDLKVVDARFQAALLEEEPEKQQNIKIETVRHVIQDMELRSMMGRWKAAVIEDAHLLVPAAANALLKSLEEPPPKAVWILVTSQREKLLATILSRCRPVRFAPLSVEIIERLLQERGVDSAQAKKLAKICDGSMSKALALSEQEGLDVAGWESDPLAAIRLPEELPKELAAARRIVEAQLERMAWRLREKRGLAAYANARSRKTLEELAELRTSLKANADPRLVLELAALAFQRA